MEHDTFAHLIEVKQNWQFACCESSYCFHAQVNALWSIYWKKNGTNKRLNWEGRESRCGKCCAEKSMWVLYREVPQKLGGFSSLSHFSLEVFTLMQRKTWRIPHRPWCQRTWHGCDVATQQPSCGFLPCTGGCNLPGAAGGKGSILNRLVHGSKAWEAKIYLNLSGATSPSVCLDRACLHYHGKNFMATALG